MDEKTFLDELLEEAEKNEEIKTEAFFDLVLLEIQQLKQKIEFNFSEAEKEIEIINQWALRKNSLLDGKIKLLEFKLASFIKEKNVKSISLPHGTLKMHKKQDRIEITDLELFLKHASKDILDVVPEQTKPSIAKIKQYIKSRGIPKGVTLIIGVPSFSYSLNEEMEEINEQEEATGIIAKSA